MHARCRNADAQLAALAVSDEVLVPIGAGGGVDADAVAAIVAGYSGTTPDLNVSTAATTTLDPGAAFSQWSQRIIAGTGAGAYTRKIALATTYPVNGAVYRVPVEIPASARPTLEFYNAIDTGTLLARFVGDADNAQYFTAIFTYRNGAWEYDGKEAV